VFQFTQPKRAATPPKSASIPAPLFQFTQPKWAATFCQVSKGWHDGFQFTQPKWAATGVLNSFQILTSVSIHAAQVGCDWQRLSLTTSARCFNSRSPNGLRQAVAHKTAAPLEVSIHAAQMGCDNEGE